MAKIVEETLRLLIESARDELRMRRKVYPRLVTDGRMTENQATEKTAAMSMLVSFLEGLLQDGQAEVEITQTRMRL